MKIRKTIEEFAIITVGTIIVAIAVFFFMLPSHVSVGSGAALAMVLSNFIPLSVSTITLIMNVGLLIIGFLLIGPEFGAKTVYCSILMPLVMGVFEKIFPNFQSITQDPLLDVICYILVGGHRTCHSVFQKCVFRRPRYRGKDHEQVSQDGSWTGNVRFRHYRGAIFCTVL